MEPATSNLDQPTPSAPAASPPNLLLMVVSGVLSFLLWLAVVVQFVFLVPRFERLFGEFKMKMPLLTEWVIHHSRWAVPAIAITALLVCISLGRRSRWPWLFLLFLLPLVINVLVGVSLYFPYMVLLDGLEGGGKK
jgi:type II secretory pathway component PulF